MSELSDILTAISSIVAAIAAIVALWISLRNLRETVNDRKIVFIQNQIKELYTVIEANGFLIRMSGGAGQGELDMLYNLLKPKQYLAGKKLSVELDPFLDKLALTRSGPTPNVRYEVMYYLTAHGDRLVDVATRERQELAEELIHIATGLCKRPKTCEVFGIQLRVGCRKGDK